MKKEDCFLLGYVQKTHGLKGEIALVLDTDSPNSYTNLKSILLLQKNILVPFMIKKIEILPNRRAIVKLEESNNVDDAQKLVHLEVHLPLSMLPNLNEDEYFLHEVLGYVVVDVEKGNLGKISNFYESPHQDLLGMTYNEVEVLIPWVDAIVKKVDKTNQIIEVDLPEGLLELNL
ncbi:MAG: 16S rRNA processing protein RimM [Bacteroidetes bacterium]|nr:MAG: 16S rRNA processing protein RimM [Bacteroidota bacterium]TAG90336.1 MAG: 16S rRNA processing protein RimM [Bacteroidota bacterium]